MTDLMEWAYASGRDRGWDVANAELTRNMPVPEKPVIPRAYAVEESTRQEFMRGWLQGLGRRRDGLAPDGTPLGFTDEENGSD